jgi:hypothetical protein
MTASIIQKPTLAANATASNPCTPDLPASRDDAASHPRLDLRECGRGSERGRDHGPRRARDAARATRLSDNAKLQTSSAKRKLAAADHILVVLVIAGILFAHTVVLYKIDTGLRTEKLTPVMASRSHHNLW